MDPNAEHVSLSKKRVSRHFSVSEKETILNTYKTYDQNHADLTKVEKVNFTAEAMGIGVASVYKILREYKNEHELKPAKVYKRKKSVLDNIDMDIKNSVRRIIHSLLIKDEPPTVKAILAAIQEREDIPDFKKSTFKKLLRELGFRYTRRSRNIMLEYNWDTNATSTSEASYPQESTLSTKTLPISETDIKIEIEEEKLFDPSSREYIEYPNIAKRARTEDVNVSTEIWPVKQEVEDATEDQVSVRTIEVYKEEPGDNEADVAEKVSVDQIKMDMGR